MSFYPIRLGVTQPIDVFFSQTTDVTAGALALVLANINVYACDAAASAFGAAIEVGDGTDFIELGKGWYRYTLDSTDCANAGVLLLHFTPDGAKESDIKCFVGAAGGTAGLLAARVEDIVSTQLLAIADVVHDEDMSAHLGTNTIGSRIADVDLAITNMSGTVDDTLTAVTVIDGIVDNIQADTNDIQTRLPATLDGVNMRASVKAMDAGVITAAVVATDAIDADAIAANAVTEIQSGLATAANLATVAGYLDTEITTIMSGVADVQTRLPATLDGANMRAAVEAYGAGLAPLQPTVAGRTLDVTATGEGGVDWGNVGSQATVVALTNTTVNATVDAVEVATAILEDSTIEGSASLGDIIRLITGILAGPVADFETGVLVFKSLNGAKTRVTITTDDTGRLSVVLGDLTP